MDEPLRTCVGCRRVRSKSEMIRIVRGPGGVGVDPVGTAPGRGAYVCGVECLGLGRRRLARALRAGGFDGTEIERAVAAAERQEVR